MAITKQEAINSLINKEELFITYSTATRHPYVILDKETSHHQVWLFAEEKDVIAFNTKEVQEKKALVTGMKLEKSQYLPLFSELYAIGVNTVVWNDGEEKIEITEVYG